MATKVKEQNASGNVYNHTYKICVPPDRVPDYETTAQKTLSTYVNDIMGVKNDHIIYDPDKVNDADCLCFVFDNNTEKEEVCLYRSNSLIGSNQIEFSSPVSSDGNKVLCLIFSITGNYIGKVDIDLKNGGGEAPTNMVTTDTEQTITGAKTFTNSAGVAVGTAPNLAEYKGDSIVHNSETIKYPSGANNKYFALTDNADGSVNGGGGEGLKTYTMTGDYSITLTEMPSEMNAISNLIIKNLSSVVINPTDLTAITITEYDQINMNLKILYQSESVMIFDMYFKNNGSINISGMDALNYNGNIDMQGISLSITLLIVSSQSMAILTGKNLGNTTIDDDNNILICGTIDKKSFGGTKVINSLVIGGTISDYASGDSQNIIVFSPVSDESILYASNSINIGLNAKCPGTYQGTSSGYLDGGDVAIGQNALNNIQDSVTFDGIYKGPSTDVPINRYINVKDPSYILFRNADVNTQLNVPLKTGYPNIMYLSEYLGLNLGTYDANTGTLTGVTAYKLNAVNVVYGTFAGETITFTKYGTVDGNILFTTSVLANGVVHNETLSITLGTLAFTLTDTQIATGTAYDAEIPTDLYASAETNELSLHHDGKAIESQTPIKLKTINGESLIGEGNITVSSSQAQIQTLQVDGIESIPVSSMATVAIQSLTNKNINIISIAPSNESVLISHPWFDGSNWKLNIYNLSQSSVTDLVLNIDFITI